MRQAIAVFTAFLLSVAALPCAGQTDAAHREAIQRYFEASRTVAFLLHTAMRFEIRTAAVERWGFESSKLSADDILAIESHIDKAGFGRQLVELHLPHLAAEDANAIARFYTSTPGRRFLGAALGPAGLLPSDDPLIRDGIPSLQLADKEVFEEFLRTPAGVRLKAAEPAITAAIFALLKSVADSAIERHVTERKLPNRKRPG